MKSLNRAWLRLTRGIRRRQLDRDLDDELRFHLEMLQSERPDARRQFGNLTSLQETCRELWSLGVFETWWQDLRYALRMLRRNPAFTAVAVLTLTLAIGVNTAIFSVMDGVMLRDLPYRDAARLAMVWSSSLRSGEEELSTSIPDFEDWQRATRSFESLAFYTPETAELIDPEDRVAPEILRGEAVSPNFFSVLGVAPVAGSYPGSGDAMLSYEFWQRRYRGSAQAIGQTLDLSGRTYRIAGVMPRSFQFPTKQAQLWIPAMATRWWPQYAVNRNRAAVTVFGKLRPGLRPWKAQAEMSAIAGRAAADRTVRVVPLQAQVLGKTVPFLLLVLFGAVVLVLLIACTNVANLLLARTAVRRREFALRSALGAGKMRLLRQRLTESTVLALAGGALGLILAGWGIRALASFGPRDIPRLDEIALNGRVAAFTLGVSLLSGALFGLTPVRTQYAGRTRNLLVAGEFALAVILLSGAGLLLRSFLAVRAVDPGFDARRVMTVSIRDRASDERHREVLDRIRAIPGVQSVGRINDIFFSRGGKSLGTDTLEVESHAPEPRERWRPLVITPVSGDAFQAMGMRLLEGRQFNAHDGEHDPLVVIVNEAMARRFWPGEDPVGKRFKGYPGNQKDWVTVVGLVKDLKNAGLEREAVSQMFAAPLQFKPGSILVIRAGGNAAPLAASIRAAVHQVDRTAVLGEFSPLEEQLDAQFAQRRFQVWLLGLFSVMALLLAAVGVYGLLHYSVAQRTREIGIRMALGAKPRDVVRMVVREGLAPAIGGVILGLAGALAGSRLLGSLLFGVKPFDPLTFVIVAVLLIAIAPAACYMPARRATRVDPITALRCD